MARKGEVKWSFLFSVESLFSPGAPIPRRIPLSKKYISFFNSILTLLLLISVGWILASMGFYEGNELPFWPGVWFLFSSVYVVVVSIGWWFARRKMWKIRIANY